MFRDGARRCDFRERWPCGSPRAWDEGEISYSLVPIGIVFNILGDSYEFHERCGSAPKHVGEREKGGYLLACGRAILGSGGGSGGGLKLVSWFILGGCLPGLPGNAMSEKRKMALHRVIGEGEDGQPSLVEAVGDVVK